MSMTGEDGGDRVKSGLFATRYGWREEISGLMRKGNFDGIVQEADGEHGRGRIGNECWVASTREEESSKVPVAWRTLQVKVGEVRGKKKKVREKGNEG